MFLRNFKERALCRLILLQLSDSDGALLDYGEVQGSSRNNRLDLLAVGNLSSFDIIICGGFFVSFKFFRLAYMPFNPVPDFIEGIVVIDTVGL